MKIAIVSIFKWIGRLMFTPEQKMEFINYVNRLKRKEHALITLLRKNLLEHGFNKRAIDDLHLVVEGRSKPYIKKLAAWELAHWYANSKTEEGAFQCLDYLKIILESKGNIEEKRNATLLKAECFEFLGDRENAKRVILEALSFESHPDLYLAAATLETGLEERINWVNNALEAKGISKISLKRSSKLPPFDSLTAECDLTNHAKRIKDDIKVSVIITAFNSADFLSTAIESIIAQTWSNIEVLIVDDCSSDYTPEIIHRYQARDIRVKYLKTLFNCGTYVARNIALKEATGDLVTNNDADDWSHPQRIETQVMHLLQNPRVIANMSEQAQATSDLKFYRRATYGKLIFSDKPSLMFRRHPVVDALGYWDSVRFGADTEFIRRLERVFGRENVVQLRTGPLSFKRQLLTSLTGNQFFGFYGYRMGARKEYFESYGYHHQKTKNFYYDFPMYKRPFPIPEPMWPRREDKPTGYRRFDVVLVSDFRFGKTTADVNIREIRAFKEKGLRIGLVQIYQFICRPTKKVSYQVRELIDGNRVQMLVYGEKINCEKLLVLDPAALKEKQRYIPVIKTTEVRVLIERLPSRINKGKNSYSADLHKVDQLLKQYFGHHGLWHPFNFKVRKELSKQDENLAENINLSMDDWLDAF